MLRSPGALAFAVTARPAADTATGGSELADGQAAEVAGLQQNREGQHRADASDSLKQDEAKAVADVLAHGAFHRRALRLQTA